MLGNFLV